MIEFDHVTRSYSGKVAVDDLSLSVPPGEIFALLGANGAGKTTTIRLLTGLLRPDSGTIRVCGHDLDGDLRQALRCLGYVPDEPFLYDKLSGREFLEFTAQMRGLNRREVEAGIAQETHNFELADYLDDLIETYSHGMKQRLIFASALLHRPPVVIIDEPMVGLDPRSMRMVKDLLREQSGSGDDCFHVHAHFGRGRGDRRPHRRSRSRPAAIPGIDRPIARGIGLAPDFPGIVIFATYRRLKRDAGAGGRFPARTSGVTRCEPINQFHPARKEISLGRRRGAGLLAPGAGGSAGRGLSRFSGRRVFAPLWWWC